MLVVIKMSRPSVPVSSTEIDLDLEAHRMDDDELPSLVEPCSRNFEITKGISKVRREEDLVDSRQSVGATGLSGGACLNVCCVIGWVAFSLSHSHTHCPRKSSAIY